MFGSIKVENDSQKSAIVTGASSGLGQASIQLLLERGYFVYGISRSGLEIEDENYVDFQCDIRSEDEVAQIFEAIEKENDGVELLINNAGVCELTPLGESSSDEFMSHLETNTLGQFHILKYFEDLLIENESHIVNILSTAAKTGFPNASAYCASKFAFKGMIESLEKEWGKYSVKITNLYPGAIKTPMWENLNIDITQAKVLTVEEFVYTLSMVVNSPFNLKFRDITFMHFMEMN